MNKIKVIDLLNRIANGEEVPDRISFCSYDYKWDKDFDDYLRIVDKQQMAFSFIENHNDNLECFLNDTVDIIEEDKKIEKIEYSIDKDGYLSVNDFREHLLQIINKINEIIDYINGGINGE